MGPGKPVPHRLISCTKRDSVPSPPFPPYVPSHPLRVTLHDWIRSPLLSRRGLGACFCRTSLLPESGGSSSQNAREGPSYADLRRCVSIAWERGGTPPFPDTCSFLLDHPIPNESSHGESEEVGFDRGLIRPPASPPPTRRPTRQGIRRPC